MSDAAWLCQLAEAGLLRASFVPPKPIRALRNLTRYRKTQIQERAREANRLHKALEDTGIKLDCVASDILGVSGRAMLDALVSGTTDPQLLADLARGKLRKKIPALQQALRGRFDRMHALWIGSILAHIDFLDEQIASLTEMIAEQIAPFEKAVELLCTITGVQRRTAECIIAEIGVDMSIFPTAKELASWAGQCPGNHQSAGKRRCGRTRNGSKWLDWALEEAALAATRSKDTYLAAHTCGCAHAAATTRRSAPSNTRSSSPAGTCSAPARSTTTSAATTSNAVTPPRSPSASSPSSNASDTPSPCWRPTLPEPQRDFPVSTSGRKFWEVSRMPGRDLTVDGVPPSCW
jgi:transposase